MNPSVTGHDMTRQPEGATMPLGAMEIRMLADFARFVDRETVARMRVRGARSLGDVVSVARSYGFDAISVNLLVKASHCLVTTDWIWQKFGRRWSDHLFVLSLMHLTDGQLKQYWRDSSPQHSSAEGSSVGASSGEGSAYRRDREARAFYDYVKKVPHVQLRLMRSRSIDEVVDVARSCGFLLEKVDFLMRKHEWRDDFFPWSGMSTQQVREFMHAYSPRSSG